MRLLLVGDAHLRTETPERRREPDFAAVCLGKWRQVELIAREHGCDAILQAGDLFDSPEPSKKLVADFIRIRRNSGTPLVCIHGQHDMAYHTQSSRERSSLAVLEAAGVLELADSSPITVPGEGGPVVCGAAFGQTAPPVIPQDKAQLGLSDIILIAHSMVGDKPLWPGQELTAPADYAAKHPGYDLYLLGDYHYPWQQKVGNAWVVNAGCLVRKAASERELAHRPKVVLYNSDGNTLTDIYLDIAQAEEAFDLAKPGKAPDRPQLDFAAMAEALRKGGRAGLDFRQNLQDHFDKHDTPTDVREAAWAAFPAQGDQ